MERKEDLTMTNKQMLVAQLRKEQEQNRILREIIEEIKNEQDTSGYTTRGGDRGVAKK